jgi:pimeloyl-ACP methyl ester carboxylesterase
MGGNTVLEFAARYPEFPAAIVMIDSAIIQPAPLHEALLGASGALKQPDYPEVMRGLFASITSPADDPVRNERLLKIMTSAPQHVMTSAFDNHLVHWDGSTAASACKVPALYIGAENFITDVPRFRELCPQLVVGQTVGAGQFNNQEVPDQVNAMIERFLASGRLAV